MKKLRADLFLLNPSIFHDIIVKVFLSIGLGEVSDTRLSSFASTKVDLSADWSLNCSLENVWEGTLLWSLLICLWEIHEHQLQQQFRQGRSGETLGFYWYQGRVQLLFALQ